MQQQNTALTAQPTGARSNNPFAKGPTPEPSSMPRQYEPVSSSNPAPLVDISPQAEPSPSPAAPSRPPKSDGEYAHLAQLLASRYVHHFTPYLHENLWHSSGRAQIHLETLALCECLWDQAIIHRTEWPFNRQDCLRSRQAIHIQDDECMSKLHFDFVDCFSSVRPFTAGRREDRPHALSPSVLAE